MKNRFVAVVSVVVAVCCGYIGLALADSKREAAAGGKPTYSATVYVAGHGGHFAKADVLVDPNDAENPLKMKSLEQVEIGTTETHKTHDARLDGPTLFWSTYALDKEGKLHVGKSDLRSGKVLKDVALTPDPRAPATTGPAYCASGQSKRSFMPVFMGNEGYIDVFDKKTLRLKHRVFVSDLGYKPGTYQFVHGTNSTDMKRFLVTVVLKGEDGKMTGKQDLIMVDMAALEKGKLKALARATLTGEPGKTITFRQYFTADDKLIYQSAADRMWVIDSRTLKLVDEKMTKPTGENHDVQPTPDGKYALLTLRTSDTQSCDENGNPIPDKKITDGALMLYDATARALVGKPVSVCFACHKDAGKGDKSAVLCGLAAKFARGSTSGKGMK
jgi:hypothetical protein